MQDFFHDTEQELTEFYIQSLANFEEAVRGLAEKYGYGSEEFNREVAKLKV
jgi:hypothetical protein